MLFCGERCRTNAYKTYHRIECEIAALLRDAAGECPYHFLLPLRTLLIGSEQGTKVESLKRDAALVEALQSKRQPSVRTDDARRNYISICNLHRDVDSLPERVLLGFCMKSSCFLHWLKQSSFFDDKVSIATRWRCGILRGRDVAGINYGLVFQRADRNAGVRWHALVESFPRAGF